MNDEVNPADLPLLLRGSVQPGDYLTSNVANRLLYAAADYIESKLADARAAHDELVSTADELAALSPVGQEIAYLDLGIGGYIDLGSAMTDEQLAKLPKGRHALGIIGTYGVDGYVAAPPAAQAVDLEQLRRALCVIGELGEIDGHGVIRRNSMLEIVGRFIDQQAGKGGRHG